MQPHYHRASFEGPYHTLTVKAILDETYDAYKSAHPLAGEPEVCREKFQLRYITEEEMAFSVPPVADHNNILEHASTWYKHHGHYLRSTCIGPDESTLVKPVVPTPDAPVVRLYVIVAADDIPTLSDAEAPPLLAKRRLYVNALQMWLASHAERSPSQAEVDALPPSSSHIANDRLHPNFGPWAYVYEPAFGYAQNAFGRGFKDVKLEVRSPLAKKFDSEVLGKNGFDIRICAMNLYDAFIDVTYTTEGREALRTLLRELFDDPTLQVNIENVEEDGHLSEIQLEIRGECHTAHGIPALYILGKDRLRLTSRGWESAEAYDLSTYKHLIVGSKYAAVREMTCCPCLIIRLVGYRIQFYLVYFSDMVYRPQQLGDPISMPFPDLSDPPIVQLQSLGFEDELAHTLQIIRNTALRLRESYTKIHTGSVIPHAPHLFPRPANFVRLPFHLDILDRVPLSSWTTHIVWRPPLHFTGVISRGDGTSSPVHVKFVPTRTYCPDAHRLLATHKVKDEPMPLAPQLYWCNELFPGLTMVVMERLDGSTFEHYLASDAALSREELQDVHTAVDVLHRHGFVHGDLRPSNVIIQRPAAAAAAGNPDGAVTRAYLLDFDLAGKAGEVDYPRSLGMDNPHATWPRPSHKLRGRPIIVADDLFMLKRFFSPT